VSVEPELQNETGTEPPSCKRLFAAARVNLELIGLPFYGIVVVASITVLGLPGLTGHTESGAAWRLALTPFWLAIGFGLPQVLRRRRRMLDGLREAGALIVLAFLASLGVGMLVAVRTSPDVNLPSALGLIMIWGTAALFAWVGTSWMPKRAAILFDLAAVSLLVYELLNLGFYLAGMGGQGGELRIAGALGIEARRVTFPMVSGPNSFGSLAGAALTWSSVWAWQTRRGSKALSTLKVMGVILSFACVLLADSRGGLILGVVSAGLVLSLSHQWISKLRWVVVFPVLVPLGLLLGDAYAGGLGLQGLWSKVNHLGTLSSRFITWRAAFSEILAPKWIHLVGYGYKGDVSSGVAQAAAQQVAPTRLSLLGPHNVILQYILDNGYLGAALFVLVMFVTIRRLAEMAATDRQSVVRPALGVMVYLALLGTIERVPTVYSPELFVVFLFIVIFTLFAPRAMDAKDSNPDGAGEDLAGRWRQEAV